MTIQSRHSEQQRLDKCKYLFLGFCGVTRGGAMDVGKVDPEYLDCGNEERVFTSNRIWYSG
jgi:hypothetical protein